MREHERVDMGLSDHARIMATMAMADDEGTAARLREALERLTEAAGGMHRLYPVDIPDPSALELETVDLPRDALLRGLRGRSGREAVGRTAAEQITPYPPGIPVVVPGERINSEVIEYLLSGLEARMVLPDPADPSLETIRVVR